MGSVKGWKTVSFGLLMIVAPSALTYLAGVDWASIGVSPAAGGVIGAVIIGLRAVTNSAMGKQP